MSADTLIILGGLLLHALGTVGGLWKMSLHWERRLTALETTVHMLPKRKGDE